MTTLQKKTKPNGYCPECNCKSFGQISQRSTTPNPLYPWSMILKSFHCQKCNTEVPAHIWSCTEENRIKARQEWQMIYKNRLGLFERAKINGDINTVNRVIEICASEIEAARFKENKEIYYDIRIMALIYLKRKEEAREWAARAISAIPNLENKKIYLKYICLCLDTKDGEAALFAFEKYKYKIQNENREFLHKKVNSAVSKGILSEAKGRKFNIVNAKQFCPICSAPVKPIARYPKYICRECMDKIADQDGQLICFSQSPTDKDPFAMSTMKGYYRRTQNEYKSNKCWVDGIECFAGIARFGGIVIQVLEQPDETKNNKSRTKRGGGHSNLPSPKKLDPEISYVDSNGNPIRIEDIDLSTTEFEDEFGRKVDLNGKVLASPPSEVAWVEIAEKILVANQFGDLIQHCKSGLELAETQYHSQLWNLLGIAYASTGKKLKAKESFLRAINCVPVGEIDSVAFANFVTVCFDIGDSLSGLQAIERFFDYLNHDGKQIILESLLEAIRSNLVTKEDLSRRMLKILKIKSRTA